MDKKHFLIKLVPSRPTFAQDMTPEERAIMQQHVTYWHEWMAKGMIVVFGPVMDPKGAYGMGVAEAADEAQVQAFIKGDPAGKICTLEYYPMKAVIKS